MWSYSSLLKYTHGLYWVKYLPLILRFDRTKLTLSSSCSLMARHIAVKLEKNTSESTSAISVTLGHAS